MLREIVDAGVMVVGDGWSGVELRRVEVLPGLVKVALGSSNRAGCRLCKGLLCETRKVLDVGMTGRFF